MAMLLVWFAWVRRAADEQEWARLQRRAGLQPVLSPARFNALHALDDCWSA